MERSVSDVESVLYRVDRPRSVDVSTFSGPLVLVIVGLAVSVVIACAEIVYYRQRGRVSSALLRLLAVRSRPRGGFEEGLNPHPTCPNQCTKR